MKNNFIQLFRALLLPFSFIIILIILNALPFIPLTTYGLGGIVMTIVALLLTYLTLKKDEKKFKDIGLKFENKTPIRFTFGFFIGILITSLMFAIIINTTSIELNYNTNSNVLSVLFWLLAFLPLAFMEEIIFRGYSFTKITNKFGIWPAQIIMGLFFTWYHDFTGTTFLNQLLGPGIWALIYGISAIWSKGLAFPTGLHMAINVVIALVGQKDERHAIWNLEYTTDVSLELREHTDYIGLIMQLCVLALGIILTEYYRRSQLKLNQKIKTDESFH